MIKADSEQRIGQIMVEEGTITREQLNRALDLQSRAGGLVRNILVNLGYAAEEDIAKALAKQLDIPYAAAGGSIPKPELPEIIRTKIPADFCRENSILPLKLESGMLSVAMLDPWNMMLIINIELMAGAQVRPLVATKAQLFRAIDELYSHSPQDLIRRNVERRRAPAGAADLGNLDFPEFTDLDKVHVKDTGDDAVTYVNAVLRQAVFERASDIHLEFFNGYVTLRFRVDGDLYERMSPPLDLYPAVISRIKILAKMDISEKRLPQDGAFAVKLQDRPIDIRVSICATIYGENAVLRILDRTAVPLNINDLGLDSRQQTDFLQAASRPHGLIFLTGPTGSGKTTTLYTLLKSIYTPNSKYITIEDPVEYRLDGIDQVQVKTNIGLTFSRALRCFLRQDPDVILVGEVRDPEVAETCLRAALTGHLVISTLHTNSALEAVPRLVDMGIDAFVLSSILCMTAAQRLVRVVCPHCREPFDPGMAMIKNIIAESMISPPPDPSRVKIYREAGCSKCAYTGFAGRSAIFEVIPINKELAEIIYSDSSNISRLRGQACRQGITSMRSSGWRKVLAGVTTVEEVLSATVTEG